jgi:hypothetical protein
VTVGGSRRDPRTRHREREGGMAIASVEGYLVINDGCVRVLESLILLQKASGDCCLWG